MKNRSIVGNTGDGVSSTKSFGGRCGRQPTTKSLYAAADPSKRRSQVNDNSCNQPVAEPVAVPRLFIRGLAGGSLKMDQLDFDAEISESAFAQWIPDESLKSIHVHRGDIAIIDPVRPLCHREVVLIGLNGREVFRRLKKQRRLWLLESLDGACTPPIPLINHPLYGVVFGFVRLAADAKAVSDDGQAATCGLHLTKSPPGEATWQTSCKSIGLPVRSMVHYAKSRRSPLLLAAEKSQSPYRLAETERTHVYSVRAITR